MTEPEPRYEEPYFDIRNPLRMDRHRGRCHICRLPRAITYCAFCSHWLCSGCRGEWYKRGAAAVKVAVESVLRLHKDKDIGPCCGPQEELSERQEPVEAAK